MNRPRVVPPSIDQFKRTTMQAIITLSLVSTVIGWRVMDDRGTMSPALDWIERLTTLVLAALFVAAWPKRVPQRVIELACLMFAVAVCIACMALPMYWPAHASSRYLAPLYLWIPVVYVFAFTVTDHRTGVRVSLGIMALFIAVSLPYLLTTGDAANRNLTLQLHFVSAVLIAALYFFSSYQYRLGSAQRTVDELAQISNTDALTGVSNRRHMASIIMDELAAGTERPAGFAILLFDVDHFKAVNDRFGHGAGDEVLVALARRAAQVLRPGDSLGRWGGDEFLAVVRDLDGGALERMAEALRHSIADQPLLGHCETTISCGVAIAGVDDTIDSLLQRADVALYAAKRAGRNRVETTALEAA